MGQTTTTRVWVLTEEDESTMDRSTWAAHKVLGVFLSQDDAKAAAQALCEKTLATWREQDTEEGEDEDLYDEDAFVVWESQHLPDVFNETLDHGHDEATDARFFLWQQTLA